MGTNELKVFFNNTLQTSYYVIPKFSFKVGSESIILEAASKTPTISSSGNIKITLLSSDQMLVEQLINSNPGATVYIDVESYAILDDLGNGNEESLDVVCTIVPESGSNKAPEVVAANYYSETNILEVEFDVNLKILEELVTITGFSLLNGSDTLTLENSILGVDNPNNKTIWISVHPQDEYMIETVTDKNAFLLLLEPFSVYQNPKLNGNWGVTATDAVPVAYNLDTTSPIPDYIKYNNSIEQLVLHFSEAMLMDVDYSLFTFAGLTFTGTSAEFGEDPSWLLLGLTDADKAALEGLSGMNKVEVTVDIQPGAFTNADSIAIDLPSTSFMDNDPITIGTETFIPLVGIGRNFWLQSKEAFPTVEREIPATIRKVGDHSVIYVADDQWRPYREVDMWGNVDSTNYIATPIIPSEVDVVFDHFEGLSPNEGAFDQINELYAVGKADKIPQEVNILICDIRDEYNLGRNDSNDGYWIGSFFNSDDQFTEWQAQGEFYTNDLDMIYLDSWPQLYSEADSSWYWYESGSTLEWRLNLPPDSTNSAYDVTNIPITIKNAVDNAYAKLLCYKVDPWESAWMVEGFGSFAEFQVEGAASFYGAGNPTTPTNNAIKNLSNGLKTRTDFFNTYLFILYLYEKYGGLDLIKKLAVQPSVDMSSIDVTFDLMLQAGTSDTTLQYLWANHTAEDVFSHYAMACLLDTSNSTFAAADTLLQDDDRMFVFDNVNLYGIVSGKNATIMKWDEIKGAPPYYINQQPWSFNYYYSTFAPLAGLSNQMIAATKLLGDTVSMADDSQINILLPFSDMNFFHLCLKNEAVATACDPYFYYEYKPYATSENTLNFKVSPFDTLWTFYHYEENASGGLDEVGDFKSIVLVGALGGSGKITKEAAPPALAQLSTAQNPLVPGRFDIYLIVSDLVWGDGSLGADIPQLQYVFGNDTTVLTMSEYTFQSAFGYPDDYSLFNSYLSFVSQGNYQLSVLFTDLSGVQHQLGPYSYAVDSYNPGFGASVTLDGAACYLDGNASDQSFYLTMQTIDGNADNVEEEEFLYNGTIFQAPPVEIRIPVGPAYSIEPDVVLDEPAWVTLPYGEYIGQFSPAELGVYLHRDGEWVFIGGQADPTTQTIKVRARQLGLLQIQSGPHPDIPVDLAVPTKYVLKQNYPNPFNPVTTINYELPFSGKTTLKVFDVMGREVVTLIDGFRNTGFYSVKWNGRTASGVNVASGVYFYRLESSKFSRTCKMILLK